MCFVGALLHVYFAANFKITDRYVFEELEENPVRRVDLFHPEKHRRQREVCYLHCNLFSMTPIQSIHPVTPRRPLLPVDIAGL